MKEEKLIFNKEKLAGIAKRHHLVFVVLFGSRARGERKNVESDLDIAVLVKKEPTYRQYMDIYGDIADLFAGENADVRLLNDADLMFRYNVVRDGILLFGDTKVYEKYKLLTIRRYVDDGKKYFPFLDQKIEERLFHLEKTL